MKQPLMRIVTILLSCFTFTHANSTSSNPPPQPTSYLDWKPILHAEDVFKDAITFTFTQTDEKGNVFWVEQRPAEGGRSVLVERDKNGNIRDVTPAPYSVRNRVYEYGGVPYVVKGSWVYFTNFKDQRIYKLNLSHSSEITPLTPERNADDSLGKYADLTVSPDGNALIFVYEKEVKQGEYPDYIGMIDLRNTAIQEPTILLAGANFYKTPQYSPDGTHLAWLQWNHPYMRWDSTNLRLNRIWPSVS